MQRNRPRDIYDLYYLSSIIEQNSYPDILKLLKLKAKNKNIDCCAIENL
jgi:predicted nucleotidyltransferase component of viral defense system